MAGRERLLQIISGQRQSVAAVLIRPILSLLAGLYGSIIFLRNRRYDRAAARGDLSRSPINRPRNLKQTPSTIQSASIPVISVGNITTGGTGKTPLVVWLTRLLQAQQLRVVIISRGYGASASRQRNDEAMELDIRLPGVPHLQSPDRVQAARRAQADFNAQVIVLDDGFQHRRLHRNLDIVLIDATNPFGYGHLLPRGLLREPKSSLARSQAIVLTRCELVSDAEKQALLSELSCLNPQALLASTQTTPKAWLRFDQIPFPLDHLDQERVLAFCGIGNPNSFLAILSRMDLKVLDHIPFADHHLFSAVDLQQIASRAKSHGAAAIVCTHKDLVKVKDVWAAEIPLYALLIETEFVSREADLRELVISSVATRSV
jgi:tetraacyldisaccharide 4'-kinase